MNTPRNAAGSERRKRPVHGVLLLDKPLGLSSNQALQKVRWLLRADKAGHTGTLDPLATGVLPICLGAATKFSQLHLNADKAYHAVLRLGVCTTTGDREGAVTARHTVAPQVLDASKLQRVADSLLGPIEQLPPMHSALKKDGKALYEYARAGIEVERTPRQVTIHALALQVQADPEGPALAMQVHCSKGTYVRTLAEAVGERLGCGAHLLALRRVRTGGFGLGPCIGLDALAALDDEARLQALLPIDTLLDGLPVITLDSDDAGRFLSGLRRRGHWPDADRVAVWGASPRALLGTGHVHAGELIADRLLSPIDIEQGLAQPAAFSPPTVFSETVTP